MLRYWQRKFPHSFERFQSLPDILESEDQKALSQLLSSMDKAGLLNEDRVNWVLDRCAGGALSRAMTLFDASSFSYNRAHFPMFFTLANVLANPLCQTIFDARLRAFSDYESISDPLVSSDADAIIKQLAPLSDQDAKARSFFDFFVSFRPFPPSQKYIVDVDVAQQVTIALTFYCKTTIEAIQNKKEYLNAKELISTLRTKGGTKLIFDQIKYEVANSIEAEDLCSTRNFDDLMNEIWSSLEQPQANLNTFVNELQDTKGYREFIAEALNRQSFLAGAGGAMEITGIEQNIEKRDSLSL